MIQQVRRPARRRRRQPVLRFLQLLRELRHPSALQPARPRPPGRQGPHRRATRGVGLAGSRAPPPAPDHGGGSRPARPEESGVRGDDRRMTVRPGPSPQITARVLHRLAPPDTGPTPCPPSEPLTRREKEVAALIAAGLTNTGIGEELVVSLATVKSHAAHLQRELGVRNRVGIAAWAWRTGLAPTERPWTSRRRRVTADGHRPVRAPPPLGRGQQLPARPLVPGCRRGIECDDVGHRAGATAPRLLHCSTDRRGAGPTSGPHKPPRTQAGCRPSVPARTPDVAASGASDGGCRGCRAGAGSFVVPRVVPARGVDRSWRGGERTAEACEGREYMPKGTDIRVRRSSSRK